MKTYIAPALVEKGGVVAQTQGVVGGYTDPDQVTIVMSVGGLGFAL